MKNTTQLIQKFVDVMKPRGPLERDLLSKFKFNEDKELCQYFLENFPGDETNSSRIAIVRFCMIFF